MCCGSCGPAQLRAFRAAWNGYPATLQALIAGHPDMPETYDPMGFCLLHLAAFRGNVDCVRVALYHGANPNAPLKESPVGKRLAARLFIEFIFSYWLTIWAVSAFSVDAGVWYLVFLPLWAMSTIIETFMHLTHCCGCQCCNMVAGNHFSRIADAPWSLGSWFRKRPCVGDTPLHLAARTGRTAIVRVLIAAGADATAVNCEGETPLVLSQQLLPAGHSCIAVLLQIAKERQEAVPAVVPVVAMPIPVSLSLPTADHQRDVVVAASDVGIATQRSGSDLPILLEQFGLVHLQQLFMDHRITVDAMRVMTDNDLQAMGVNAVGDHAHFRLLQQHLHQRASQLDPPPVPVGQSITPAVAVPVAPPMAPAATQIGVPVPAFCGTLTVLRQPLPVSKNEPDAQDVEHCGIQFLHYCLGVAAGLAGGAGLPLVHQCCRRRLIRSKERFAQGWVLGYLFFLLILIVAVMVPKLYCQNDSQCVVADSVGLPRRSNRIGCQASGQSILQSTYTCGYSSTSTSGSGGTSSGGTNSGGTSSGGTSNPSRCGTTTCSSTQVCYASSCYARTRTPCIYNSDCTSYDCGRCASSNTCIYCPYSYYYGCYC